MDVIKAINLNLDAQGLSLKLFTQSSFSFNSRLRMTQMIETIKIVRKPSVLHGLHLIRFRLALIHSGTEIKDM